MTLWTIGFLAGALVVLIVAIVLLGIIVQARRILKLAQTASAVVAEIDQNTRAVWALRDTNQVAGQILENVQSIDSNASAVVVAVSRKQRSKTNA